MEKFTSAVADYRGRPISLVGEDLGDGAELSGAWLAFESNDVIVFDRSASVTLRDAIIVHEIGHMMYGHRNDSGSRLRGAAPRQGEALRHAICRSAYDAADEREAEDFATKVLVFMEGRAHDGVTGRIA